MINRCSFIDNNEQSVNLSIDSLNFIKLIMLINLINHGVDIFQSNILDLIELS